MQGSSTEKAQLHRKSTLCPGPEAATKCAYDFSFVTESDGDLPLVSRGTAGDQAMALALIFKRIRSLIMAINSLLVGLPLALDTV